jgi:excisionase family DNA binding protein
MKTEAEPAEKLLNVRGLSHLIGVKQPTIRKWVHERRIPFLKVGRCVRFRPSPIERWLKRSSFEGRSNRKPSIILYCDSDSNESLRGRIRRPCVSPP